MGLLACHAASRSGCWLHASLWPSLEHVRRELSVGFRDIYYK